MKKLSCVGLVLGVGLAVVPVLLNSTVRATPPRAAATAAAAEAVAATPAVKPDEAALERARKSVRLLDDIYKKTIVLITDKYVNSTEDFAAGSAAVLLFEQVTDTGLHKVRLIDATGEPYDPDNVAEDDFEKLAIEKIKAGAASFEQVAEVDGKPVLRVCTSVPVVMKKCVMCHDHYNDAKEGEPIGAISYSVPIE